MLPPNATQADAIALYRKCLLTHSPRWSGWRKLNHETIDRWSLSALDRIKREAWR